MEQITRLNTNLRLLKCIKNRPRRRQPDGQRGVVRPACGRFCADHISANSRWRWAEHQARAKHPHAFVAGYTNGYVHYAPTAEQLKNIGGAQEDSDCMLAPEWQLSTRHVRCRWLPTATIGRLLAYTIL